MSNTFETTPIFPSDSLASEDAADGQASPTRQPYILEITDYSNDGPPKHTAIIVSQSELDKISSGYSDDLIQIVRPGEHYLCAPLPKAEALPFILAAKSEIKVEAATAAKAKEGAYGVWALKATLPTPQYLPEHLH